jgi:hypothetical protein
MSEEWKVPLIFIKDQSSEIVFKMFPDVPIKDISAVDPLLKIIQDKPYEYSPLPTQAPSDRTVLDGLWLASAFVPESFDVSWASIEDRDIILAKSNLATKEQRDKTAFLHIPSGDAHAHLLPYFAKAMEQFPEDIRFLVFSNEPEKAKLHSIFNDRCVFIDEPSELVSLFIMSNCHYGAITANSVYSWWGAFLGHKQSSSYKAYMPSPWLNSATELTQAIYPAWAIVLSTDIPTPIDQ